MTGWQSSEWRRLWPHLAAALELAGGTHDELDLLSGVAAGEFTFHAGRDAAVLVEHVVYPRLRADRLFLGGGALAELKQLEPVLAAAARARGCRRLEIAGRRGWGRVLPGYREAATLFVKEFEP